MDERQSRYRTGRGMERTMSTRASTNYDSSSPGLHSLSQPAFPADVAGTHYQSRTLPRPRRNGHAVVSPTVSAAAHVPAGFRRRIVSSRVSDYLKSLNSMTRSIVLEKEYVEERHAGQWPAMDETLQEEVVDEHFMPADVHAHYGTLPRSRRTSNSSLGALLEPQPSSVDPALLCRSTQSRLSQVTPDSVTYPAADLASSSPTYFIPPTHNRLHKNQLSYRSKSLRKVMNIPPSCTQDSVQKRDSGLGSDGESPRTSDEDGLHNPLGFQRNHLRSFSQRQRRGGGSSRPPNSLSRSSTRRAHRTTGSEESRSSGSGGGVGGVGGSNTHRMSPFPSQRSRKQYNSGYDAEVDMPDEALLLDHVSPTHPPPDTVAQSRLPAKPSRYSSRTRHTKPRILVEQFPTGEEENDDGEVVVIPNSISRVASNSSTGSTMTDNNFDPSLLMFCNKPAVVFTNLRRAQSEDSIDTDTLSNVSNLSKSTGMLTEDESLLSVPTSTTNSLALSRGKGSIVRSRPQSLRGGSFYQTSTSEFANRRAQFKPNMLRNQLSAQNSPAHSRQSTPSFSRQNTPSLSSPSPSDASQRDHCSLTSPLHSSIAGRQRRSSTTDSIAPSEDADVNFSDFLSSPPHTPLTKSVVVGGASHHLRVYRESREQKRESGYVSSSSESFPFSAQK